MMLEGPAAIADAGVGEGDGTASVSAVWLGQLWRHCWMLLQFVGRPSEAARWRIRSLAGDIAARQRERTVSIVL